MRNFILIDAMSDWRIADYVSCTDCVHVCMSCMYVLAVRVAHAVFCNNRHSPLHAAFICPALAPIPNGAIIYAPDMTAPYDVDTVATHSCDPGFRLSGFETRQCLAGGIWSTLIPVCVGTYNIRYRF